jgi:oligopeptide/dipeptide ABC transporter ATP-binding protein
VAALRVEGLVKHFTVRRGLFGADAGRVRAVDGVSFEVEAGRTMAIVGESGCGKSTLARALLRLVEPDAGRVLLDGQDLRQVDAAALLRARSRIQMIFQDPYGSLNPRMAVGDMLEEPLRLHAVVPSAARAARVRELLSLVGLPSGAARRYPHEFSGGQRQRLAIARALAAQPRVIVCDEPVSALDVSIQAQILNLLADLQREFGLAYVFISHDLAVVRQVATTVGVMYLGRLVETAPAATLFNRPLHPYTRALLDAAPVPDPSRRRARALLSGDLPSPIDPPPGCRFHTRCPHADARCSAETPGLEVALLPGMASAPNGLAASGQPSPALAASRVACWHWDRLPVPSAFQDEGAVVARPGSDVLRRLQSAFVRPPSQTALAPNGLSSRARPS